MSSHTASTGTTVTITSVAVELPGWRAYGVLAEDGGISWQTYESVEEAKQDRLYRGRAKIIRLNITNRGVEMERTPSDAELFMRELRDMDPA